MKKHTPIKIWDSLFLMQYYVSYGVSRSAVKKAVKETLGANAAKNIPLIGVDGLASHYTDSKGVSIVWIWTLRKDISVLAHECFHAVSYTMQDKSVPLNTSTQEVFAYMLEMLIHAVLEKQ